MLMTDPKKILIIGPGIGQKGGISSVVESIYNSNINLKYKFIILNTYGKKRIFTFLKSIFKFIKIMHKENPNLIHINLSSYGSFYRKLFFFIFLSKKQKLIIHLHSGKFFDFYDSQISFMKRLIKYSFNKADKVIVVADFLIDELYAHIGIKKDKIIRVYNGIDITNFSNNKNYDGCFNILYMAKFCKERGIYDFIDIIELMKDIKGIKFIIAGYGDNDKIKNILKKKNLFHITNFLGWISGEVKDRVLNSTQLLIAPSYYESFGIYLIEAFSLGIPVIGYDKGSIPELVSNGENGYVVEAGNKKAIVDNILKLKADKYMRDRIYSNNIKKSKKFSSDNFIKCLDEVYCDMF